MKVWGHASVGLIGAVMVIFGVLLIPKATNMVLVYVVKQVCICFFIVNISKSSSFLLKSLSMCIAYLLGTGWVFHFRQKYSN